MELSISRACDSSAVPGGLALRLSTSARLLLLADSETQICAEARRIAGAQLADIRARQAELAE
jgi:hypothetical protein